MKPMTIGEFSMRTGFAPAQVRKWIGRYRLDRKPYTNLVKNRRMIFPGFVKYMNNNTRAAIDESMLEGDLANDGAPSSGRGNSAHPLPSAQQLRQLREMVSDGILLPSELRKILGFEPWPADKESADKEPAEIIETESGVIEFAQRHKDTQALNKPGGTQ